MADPECTSEERTTLEEALLRLEAVSPGVPLLALGQTVFWDEPMKAGVAHKLSRMGVSRRFIAGVHDTDYFAKLPSGKPEPGRFRAFPHNDTTTRALWSAAGEFSALFGSETVVTRDVLAAGGLRLERVAEARPGFLDEVTEAWGWRGIVSLEERPPVTAELPLKPLFDELRRTFDWSIDATLSSLAGEGRAMATELAENLRTQICEHAEGAGQSLGQYYRALLPTMYEFAAGTKLGIETTATTELLRFATDTCDLPRFEILDRYVNQSTRAAACAAYDQAIRGSAGLYELSKFGTGAIPFDLVIPGLGRGTIRLGTRGAVIMTPRPQFLSFRRPLTGVGDLAAAIEAKFGPQCTLVGKAVTLIGMLAREFVFVFHEGASGYVRHSRRLHQLLAEQGNPIPLNPILRVQYDAWEALRVSCSWLRLPEPFQRAFGTEELCAPSFSDRWREVAAEADILVANLGRLRRPIDLLSFLEQTLGGAWHRLAWEYAEVHRRLGQLDGELQKVRAERDALYAELRELRRERETAERRKGDHFRARIFEKTATPDDVEERARLTSAVESTIHRQTEVEARMRHARKGQYELIQDPEVRKVHERRQAIELEAELKRARLIRDAYTTSHGLAKAGVRPSAWWFPLVCPDGLWFRETMDTARCYLEPLV